MIFFYINFGISNYFLIDVLYMIEVYKKKKKEKQNKIKAKIYVISSTGSCRDSLMNISKLSSPIYNKKNTSLPIDYITRIHLKCYQQYRSL